ncbi:hypothetical protein LXA43DRAFT_1101313 [Ganoderma leucocontextum]|nr:hypothetical protein LXA43DRAFT_1101313 [Ganoderma leucocontextum]
MEVPRSSHGGRAHCARYSPQKCDPKTTVLIFQSGKMVVIGAKSEDDSRLASCKYARIVQKLRFDTKISEFTRESSPSPHVAHEDTFSKDQNL